MEFDKKYYKLLADLKKATEKESVRERFANAFEHRMPEDELVYCASSCRVQEDWVTRIEAGLDELSIAIAENRSFLKAEGRVVPIEKAKKISKASIFHLAKHSEYVKQTDEQGGVYPEKIHISENLDDYSVYENRFLYMVLRTVESFVELRCREISRAENSKTFRMKMGRTVEASGKKMSVQWEFAEEQTHRAADDPMVQRVYELSRRVGALLRTELMRQMADALPLKPPITRTNVLKTNRHFRAVLELYEYIMSYDGKGYEVFQRREEVLPPDKESAGELALVAALQSEVCLLIDHAYREEQEKQRLKDEKERASSFSEARKERLALLLRGVAKGEISLGEALILLEEEEREEREKGQRIVRDLKAELEKKKAALNSEQIERQRERQGHEVRMRELQGEKEEILAQLDAFRAEYGRIDPLDMSYTDKERFDELEREYKHLKKLYNTQWSKTKKVIRQKVFKKKKGSSEGKI